MERTGERLDVLAFDLAGQAYALPLDSVRSVVRAVAVTTLPEAPALVEGVIDVHGTVVPVLNVRSRFRLPPRPVRPDDHMILARAGGRDYALRVDRVVRLLGLEPDDIVAAERVAPDLGPIAGVARTRDGLILIHDLARFLSAADADELDAALAADDSPDE